MKAIIYKLTRYRLEVPTVCPYCLMNFSIGLTKYGILGCRFCQEKVDKAIEERFTVKPR